MQRDLEPGEPDDAEEAEVGREAAEVGDGVRLRKGLEVGDEEEVREELDGVGAVPHAQLDLARVLVGGRHGGLDPGQRRDLFFLEVVETPVGTRWIVSCRTMRETTSRWPRERER